MIKLYGGAFSRAAIVKWYLEELQLPYQKFGVRASPF
jgi:glutathione S-transferase